MTTFDQERFAREMDALLAKANGERKFLRSHYQGILFSPKELREAQAKGDFRWGPANWKLIDTDELLLDARVAIDSAKSNEERLRKRIVEGFYP